MADVKIRGRVVDVDIEKELERFTWHKAKWSATRLMACSPFRYDSSPSFYVYLEDTLTAPAGSWGDSGGTEWGKGQLVQLLAFLMDVTEDEVVEYLLEKYASEWDGEGELFIDMSKMKEPQQRRRLDSAILDAYKFRHPYLAGRGISESVQRLMRIGYDQKRNAVTIPYFTPDGRLATIKYRKTDSKIFFYEKGGKPVRELVYGLDVVYAKNLKRVVITEAEIDAMYAMTCGKIGAIAVGTSKLSDEKVDAILRSPIEEILIAADNDDAGAGLAQQIRQKLGGLVRLRTVDFPKEYKDLNDIKDADELKGYIDKAKAAALTLI